MKRTVCLLLLTVIIALSLSACSTKSNDDPDIIYTSEILIDKEMPDESLVWEVYLEAPTPGRFILEISQYSTYAHISPTGISPTTERSGKYMINKKSPSSSSFFDFGENNGDIFYRGSTPKHVLKLLGMTEEEFATSINKYFDIDSFCYYDDLAFGHLIISDDLKIYQSEELVKYAGKNLYIEYDYNTTYITAISEEDMLGAYTSSFYNGRIGDKYYFKYGYYSFTEHNFFPYLNADELPPVYRGIKVLEIDEVRPLLLADENVNGFISENCYLRAMERVENKYHVLLGEGNRYYGSSIEDFKGDSLLYAIIDIETHEVVYLQKIFLENYWGSYTKFALYSIGDDGIPYDVMLP